MKVNSNNGILFIICFFIAVVAKIGLADYLGDIRAEGVSWFIISFAFFQFGMDNVSAQGKKKVIHSFAWALSATIIGVCVYGWIQSTKKPTSPSVTIRE